jgi:uncharacterized protein YaaR (DUF327 family)
MDKIDFNAYSLVSQALNKSTKQETKKAGKGQKGGKTLFQGILENAASNEAELGALRKLAPSEEALTQLMDAVHSAGSDLIDRPYHEEILRYKKAVRDFINYIVENAFDVQRSQTRRGGKIKTHVQVQVIDSRLEELAAAILSGQTNQLERMSKLDEIKGLLVDLTIQGVIRVWNE